MCKPVPDGVEWRCHTCGFVHPRTFFRECEPPAAQRLKVPQNVSEYDWSWPGLNLKRILSQWGFSETATCCCDEFASKMDRWGVDGCTEHLDTDIVPWMVEQFEKRRAEPEGLSVTAKAIVATTPKLLVPVLARRLVKRAIRTARRKQAKNDYQAPHANRH